MTVACPADAWEVRALLRDALQSPSPVYLRIGKKGEPNVHDGLPPLRLGQGYSVRSGQEIALLCAGTLLPAALEAAKLLSVDGLSPEVVSFHTVKPLDHEFLSRVFRDFRLVVTVEEHSLIGGLGSAVAEWKADGMDAGARLLRLGTPDAFLHGATDQDHARQQCGLTGAHLAASIRTAWQQCGATSR